MTVYTSTTLPIELIKFYAQVKNNHDVNLIWQTATEINNKVFDIERSFDGENFESIGQVVGANNSNEVLNYDFTDTKLPNGTYYYRLKQTDFDGTFSYSNIVVIKIKNGASNVIKVYPNPSTDGIFNVMSELEIKNTQYAVYDEKMQLIMINKNMDQINLSEKADGVYYLVQQMGESKSIQRLIKFTKTK